MCPAEAEIVEGADLTLWLGDLNYRINGSRPMVHFLLAAGMTEVLHANEQLRLQQRKGRVFQVGSRGRLGAEQSGACMHAWRPSLWWCGACCVQSSASGCLCWLPESLSGAQQQLASAAHACLPAACWPALLHPAHPGYTRQHSITAVSLYLCVSAARPVRPCLAPCAALPPPLGPVLTCPHPLCPPRPPQGYQEGRLAFPPTFKYRPGTTTFSDHRVPSWTDRVLFKVHSRHEQHAEEEATAKGSSGGGLLGHLLPPRTSHASAAGAGPHGEPGHVAAVGGSAAGSWPGCEAPRNSMASTHSAEGPLSRHMSRRNSLFSSRRGSEVRGCVLHVVMLASGCSTVQVV
jgi:hypothetical protein